MLESAVQQSRMDPAASVAALAPAVARLLVYESDGERPGVLIPRPEIQLVVRFGACVPKGLDIHAFGARERVHRKLILRGLRTVTARLRLGESQAVLGVPASQMSGRVVTLEDLWGGAETRALHARLVEARNTAEAASMLDRAIAARLASAAKRDAGTKLALVAADRLMRANVNAVAVELGVSDRHLRRVFRDSIGLSPKAFARLTRFRRALGAARAQASSSWAAIAAEVGYYDQAHLIAEFRAIAGVTPRVLLGELRAAPSLG